MQTNLTDGYVTFINNGGSVEHIVQELIDRAQYIPGFMQLLIDVVEESESPFEEVNTPEGRIRRVKQSFLKNDTNESNSNQPDKRDNANGSIRCMEVSWRGNPLEASKTSH